MKALLEGADMKALNLPAHGTDAKAAGLEGRVEVKRLDWTDSRVKPGPRRPTARVEKHLPCVRRRVLLRVECFEHPVPEVARTTTAKANLEGADSELERELVFHESTNSRAARDAVRAHIQWLRDGFPFEALAKFIVCLLLVRVVIPPTPIYVRRDLELARHHRMRSV